MKIQIFGDISLDGLYCDPQQHDVVSSNMEYVSNKIGEADLRIVNWESPLWGDGVINNLKYPRLTTSKDAASSIMPLNFNLANLANNHIYDNGLTGYHNTLDFFKKKSIDFIGASEDELDARKHFIFEKDGLLLGVLSYVGLETNPMLPKDCPVFLNYIEYERIISEIKELKPKVDKILLLLHWGSVELVRVPNVMQRKNARDFIEAGADIIVGSHVHTLQGWEKWKNGVICYSIGNFIFSPHLVLPGRIDSLRPIDTRRIGIPEFNIQKDCITLKWHYFKRDKYDLLLTDDVERKVEIFHKRLNKNFMKSDKKFEKAYKFEKRVSVLRSFVSKNGGIIKALLSIRLKQFILLRKI